jgi:hypothetical protein
VISKISEQRAVPALAESARRLLNAGAVRARAHHMLQSALNGDLAEWTVDLGRLTATAEFVAETVRGRYPRLEVPVHSRWRHFEVRGRDLWRDIVAAAPWRTEDAAARAAFDLVIMSVLLDAGAGSTWRYRDAATDLVVARSEGLALASLRWFTSGGLSDDPRDRCRVDGAALRRVERNSIQTAFQATDDNELLGLDGRAALLRRLGAVMESRPDLFALADSSRPGGLFDALRARAVNGRLPAAAILELLLEALGPVWDGRPSLGGVPLGDCWPYPALPGADPADTYVPLHKLSQWLSYSLIEPLENAGIAVHDVGQLTGLAEYRNGGLFVDMGVLKPREPIAFVQTHPIAAPLIVAWRSLTVALLDRLAPLVGARLGLAPDRFPLACMLEGGTWAAGRLIAGQRRADGAPPFKVLSDGTVF